MRSTWILLQVEEFLKGCLKSLSKSQFINHLSILIFIALTHAAMPTFVNGSRLQLPWTLGVGFVEWFQVTTNNPLYRGTN